VTSFEDAKCLGCPSTSKTDENADRVKKPVRKNRKTLVCEVPDVLGFHLGQFRAFQMPI
jgi:hypothetical protein